jgi:hypothetical protein
VVHPQNDSPGRAEAGSKYNLPQGFWGEVRAQASGGGAPGRPEHPTHALTHFRTHALRHSPDRGGATAFISVVITRSGEMPSASA